METREAATIVSATYGVEDHGILTCSIGLDFGGSYQSFGNLSLSQTTGPDFRRSISEFFGKSFDALVGTRCFALRNFKRLHAQIQGLEREDGKRFTLYGWQRKHWKEAVSPLGMELESIHAEIRHLKRRLREEETRLETLASDYVDWEVA